MCEHETFRDPPIQLASLRSECPAAAWPSNATLVQSEQLPISLV
jgi:hypothetical protein